MRFLLRIGFEFLERGADRIFRPQLNPLAQLGALGFFLFWIVSVSGIYLFIFFDTGVIDAYGSVEAITHAQWFAGGVMRSFHRYASDLMVVVLLVHMTREFALDRYRGVRWFSWFTGVPIIWMLYASGITGYWQVTERNASTFEHRVKLDVEYVRSWSPWLDLYVIARTVPVVLGGTGS